jgi:hypothetical protein
MHTLRARGGQCEQREWLEVFVRDGDLLGCDLEHAVRTLTLVS